MRTLRKREIAKVAGMQYRVTKDGWELVNSRGTVGTVGRIEEKEFLNLIAVTKEK